MKVQVIILTYKDRYQLLHNVLLSLKIQNCINDILIIDNGCNYFLEDRLKESNIDTNTRVIKIDEPHGTTRALQMALNSVNSCSTHVLILDDDNLLNGDLHSVESMLRGNVIVNFLRSEREPYCTYYRRGQKISLLNNSFNGFSLTNYIVNKLFKIGYTKQAERNACRIEADYLPYGGTIFPVSLLTKITINEEFILYHDDIDFFYRAKKIGYKLLVSDHCTTLDIDNSWHDLGEGILDSISKNPVNIYYSIRNKIFFERRVCTSILFFNMNRLIWTFTFKFLNFKKRNTNEYAILMKALDDGLASRLGKYTGSRDIHI